MNDQRLVKLYGVIGGTGLENDLDLRVDRSAAGGTCAGFSSAANVYTGLLSDLGADYANGASSLVPLTTSETVAYEFTVTLDPNTDTAEQGNTATADFFWEVRTA